MSDPKKVEAAFLESIREAPDDDAPRLVYADWLTDHGDALGQARAELIRVQCELARLAPDDPCRGPLTERELAILDAHRLDWTDLAFADWLDHRKRECRNPLGHEFCKIVRKGIRTRCERDRTPESDPRWQKLADTLEDLGERMDVEFEYTPESADMPLFDDATFRRGFIEVVTIQDWAVDLFAEALPHLTMARELIIDNDAEVMDGGDTALLRLSSVLHRLPLDSLTIEESITDFDVFAQFVHGKGVRRITNLDLWFENSDSGDEYVLVLAASPQVVGLRELELEHANTFTDTAFLAVLDSPYLTGLTKCRLRPNEAMPLSPAVVRRFAARFGPQIDEDATV